MDLIEAVKNNDLERIKLLLKQKDVNINQQDEYGYTALITVSYKGYEKIEPKMHEKLVIFERNIYGKRLAWYGSYNPTYGNNNKENAVVDDNPAVIATLEEHFNLLWNEAVDAQEYLTQDTYRPSQQPDVSDRAPESIGLCPIII